MAKVRTSIYEIEIEGDGLPKGKGVDVTCDKCGNSAECRGTSGRSLRRCAVILKETCPLGESNYYVV